MVLTINMLLKGCEDQDPTIRGLSLRSLCSLTIANLTEYLVCTIDSITSQISYGALRDCEGSLVLQVDDLTRHQANTWCHYYGYLI